MYYQGLPDYNVGNDYNPMDTAIIPGLTFYANVEEPAGSSTGLWILLAILAALVLLPGKKSTEG